MSKSPIVKTPAPASKMPSKLSSSDDVQGFLQKVKAMAPAARSDGKTGRLIFALDATMSREATWDQAQHIQAGMFAEAARISGLDVQLVFFRGYNECRASRWVNDPNTLAKLMTKVKCQGGHTQIGKILSHIKRETAKSKVDAVVYVGDCMEEDVDSLCAKAGQIGLLAVPVFMFQEGYDGQANAAFKEIARLTGGAHCRFSSGSADQLRQLLRAVAIYAAGGRKALAQFARGNSQGSLLLEQMK